MAANAAAAKKKLEEKCTKILRELVSLPVNRNCFDCGQRGPTYVNMTIGSYVCTTCSGLLRGLNPPHRIKSITMATFTQDEIEFLKTNGNEICAKVYLALFDNKQTPPENSSKNPQAVRDFLTIKYERRQWYVAPSQDQIEEARKQNNAALEKLENDGSSMPRSVSMPIAAKPIPVKQEAPPVSEVVAADRSENERTSRSNSISQSQSSLTNQQAATSQPSGPKLVNAVPTLIGAATKLAQPTSASVGSGAGASRPSGAAKVDLLADFGDDPFAVDAKQQTAPTAAGATFTAQFEDAFGSTPFTSVNTAGASMGASSNAQATSKFADPFESGPFSAPVPVQPQKQPAPVATNDLASLNFSQPAPAAASAAKPAPGGVGGQSDSASKYAALAELDELFKSTTVTSQPQPQQHATAHADPFGSLGGHAQFMTANPSAPFAVSAGQTLPFSNAQFTTANTYAFAYPTAQGMPFGNVVFATPAANAFGMQLQPATAASNPFAAGSPPSTAFGVMPAPTNLFANAALTQPAAFGTTAVGVFDASAIQSAAFAPSTVQPNAFTATMQPAFGATTMQPAAFSNVDWKADFGTASNTAASAWPNGNSVFDTTQQPNAFGVGSAPSAAATARNNPFL